MNLRTRPTEATDAAALARMNGAFNGSSDPPEVIAERLARFGHIETPILAEVDGDVAGFACLRVVPCVLYAEPHAEVTEMYVEPAYRRRGVGRALIAHAERLAAERGAIRVMILVDPANDIAQAFYRQAGYNPDDLSVWKSI